MDRNEQEWLELRVIELFRDDGLPPSEIDRKLCLARGDSKKCILRWWRGLEDEDDGWSF